MILMVFSTTVCSVAEPEIFNGSRLMFFPVKQALNLSYQPGKQLKLLFASISARRKPIYHIKTSIFLIIKINLYGRLNQTAKSNH